MTLPPLLVTRLHEDAETFVAAVEGRFGQPVQAILSPLFEIVPVAAEPPPCRGLILTSRHGAAAAARLGLPRDLPAFCVGPATTLAAADLGFDARDLGGDAARLKAALRRIRPEAPLLHLRGRHARGGIAARLSADGLPTDERVVYDQAARPLSPEAARLLQGELPAILPVFSPRSAALLAAAEAIRAPLDVVAISAAAAAPFDRMSGVRVHLAGRPDAQSMVDATAERLIAATGSSGAG